VRPFLSIFGAILWFGLVGSALGVALSNWEALFERGQGALSPANLPILLVAFVLAKLVHEFGHGYAVKRFGGESIKSHWSFSVFCLVRKLFGVSFELRTLILTEIVSNVYYQMMLKHGGARDEAIAQMCRLIIRDETGHITFHKDRMARSEKRFGMIWAGIFNLMGLAAGTMLWINHGKAIRALGGKNSEFYQEIWHAMDRFIITLRKQSQEEAVDRKENLQPVSQR
jgi:hypothetical protein